MLRWNISEPQAESSGMSKSGVVKARAVCGERERIQYREGLVTGVMVIGYEDQGCNLGTQ